MEYTPGNLYFFSDEKVITDTVGTFNLFFYKLSLLFGIYCKGFCSSALQICLAAYLPVSDYLNKYPQW